MPRDDHDTIIDPPGEGAERVSSTAAASARPALDPPGEGAERVSSTVAASARPALAPPVEPPSSVFEAAPEDGAATAALPAGASRGAIDPGLAPTPSLLPATRKANAGRRVAFVLAAFVAAGVGVVAALAVIDATGPAGDRAGAGGAVAAAGDGAGGSPMHLEGGPHGVDEHGGRAGAARSQGGARLSDLETASIGLGLRSGERGAEAVDAGSVVEAEGAGAAEVETDAEGQAPGPRSRRRPGSSARRRGRPLAGEAVRSTVASNRRSIRRCHEREMRRTGLPLDTRIVVRIGVAPSGSVREAAVTAGAPQGSPLASCIEAAVRRWRFPEASGRTEVETPFVLASRM